MKEKREIGEFTAAEWAKHLMQERRSSRQHPSCEQRRSDWEIAEQRLAPGVARSEERGSAVDSPQTRNSAEGFEWNGKTHHPLPHESAFGSYSRFLLMNGISGWSEVGMQPRFTSRRSPFGIALHADFSELEKRMGWSVRDAQSATTVSLPALAPVLFSESPRICYQCLSKGYHSTWHQFLPLSRCPLDQVALSSKCAGCDAPLRPWKSWNRLDPTRLFWCFRCKAPPAFVKFSTTAHQGLINRSDELRAAFEPFEIWLNQAQEKLWPLEQLISQCQPLMWTNWTDIFELTRSAIASLHPLPAGCEPWSTAPVRLVFWDQRKQYAEVNAQRVKINTALEFLPYIEVLAQLQQKVYPGLDSKRLASDVKALQSHAGLSSRKRRESEVALALLRVWFEEPNFDFSNIMDVSKARPRGRLPVPQEGVYYPVVAQRAIVYACFYVLVQLVRLSRGRVFFGKDFSEDTLMLKYMVPVATLPAAEAQFVDRLCIEGAVLFVENEIV